MWRLPFISNLSSAVYTAKIIVSFQLAIINYEKFNEKYDFFVDFFSLHIYICKIVVFFKYSILIINCSFFFLVWLKKFALITIIIIYSLQNEWDYLDDSLHKWKKK